MRALLALIVVSAALGGLYGVYSYGHAQGTKECREEFAEQREEFEQRIADFEESQEDIATRLQQAEEERDALREVLDADAEGDPSTGLLDRGRLRRIFTEY